MARPKRVCQKDKIFVGAGGAALSGGAFFPRRSLLPHVKHTFLGPYSLLAQASQHLLILPSFLSKLGNGDVIVRDFR